MNQTQKSNNVHYKIIGEGTPIVLLHGWSLNHQHMESTFEPIFEQRQGWRRIYPDLPGHGKTPGQDWIQNQDQMLEVILEFINEVVGEERLIVGGVSAGGYLARGVLYHKQKSIDGLLLVVPLMVAEDEKRSLPLHTVIVEDQELISGLSGVEGDVLGMAVVQSQKLLNRLRSEPELLKEAGDAEFRALIRENPERYAFSFDVDNLSKPFDGPTLIITGKQDAFAGYRDAWRLVENYPRGTFAVLDRAGHLLELEQEDLFSSLVSEWLDRVEEYVKK